MTLSLGTPNMMDLLRVCCTPQEDEREQYIAMTGEDWIVDDVASELFLKAGPKFVLLTEDDERAVAVGGFDLLLPNVWNTWMIAVDGVWQDYGSEITYHCRETLKLMFTQGEARRIQTLALTSREKACNWYEKGLRMRRESVARNYGTGGEDIACYVRFRE